MPTIAVILYCKSHRAEGGGRGDEVGRERNNQEYYADPREDVILQESRTGATEIIVLTIEVILYCRSHGTEGEGGEGGGGGQGGGVNYEDVPFLCEIRDVKSVLLIVNDFRLLQFFQLFSVCCSTLSKSNHCRNVRVWTQS